MIEFTTEQHRSIDSLGRRHGALSIVRHANGDAHVQVIGGRRAWMLATDGRAVSAPRRPGTPTTA